MLPLHIHRLLIPTLQDRALENHSDFMLDNKHVNSAIMNLQILLVSQESVIYVNTIGCVELLSENTVMMIAGNRWFATEAKGDSGTQSCNALPLSITT